MLKNYLFLKVERAWYRKSWYMLLLLPFTILYTTIILIRVALYRHGILKVTHFNKPVVVVGNILVGGTGKTPMTIALVKMLIRQGVRVGVISRGYGGVHVSGSHRVTDEDQAAWVGEEPILIYHETRATVIVNRRRSQGIRDCLAQHAVDIVICDDGLQDESIAPALKIAIHPKNLQYFPVCLPAGPLREPLMELNDCDVVVRDLHYRVEGFTNAHGHPVDIAGLKEQHLTAVSAIARPDRFMHLLKEQGLNAKPCFFADHHAYVKGDLTPIKTPIITTEKDWIKLKDLPLQQPVYIVKVAVDVPDDVVLALARVLEKKA